MSFWSNRNYEISDESQPFSLASWLHCCSANVAVQDVTISERIWISWLGANLVLFLFAR
jgi:hypothetical protein